MINTYINSSFSYTNTVYKNLARYYARAKARGSALGLTDRKETYVLTSIPNKGRERSEGSDSYIAAVLQR